MENQIVPSEKGTFNGSRFANRDGLLLRTAAGDTSKGRPLSSLWIASTSLEQALADLRNEFPLASAQFRILVTGHPKVLNPSIQEEINLIAREALANAFHHSNATRIEAEVEYLPAKLRVVIRDGGRGMDPQAQRLRQNSHWGLLGMRERARSIGAHLRIWSKPGLGTEVEVSISSELATELARAPRPDLPQVWRAI